MLPAFLPSLASLAISSWTPVLAIPADQPTRVCTSGSRLVGLSVDGPRISDDGGVSWKPSRKGLPSLRTVPWGDCLGDSVVVYSAGGIHLSTDRGDSWHDWSEGYPEPERDEQIPRTLALGDTGAVLLTGFPDQTRGWFRHGDLPWTPIDPAVGYSGTVVWTGSSFLMRSADSLGTPRILRSVDGETWAVSRMGIRYRTSFQRPASHGDTTWLLHQDTLLASRDGGATWDAGWIATGVRSLFATNLALFATSTDSLLRIDLADRKVVPLRSLSGESVRGISLQGDRIVVALASGFGLVSGDSGRTWSEERLGENGTLSTAITRDAIGWAALGNDGIWLSVSTDWDGFQATDGTRSLLTHQGNLYAGGLHPYRFVDSWLETPVPCPSRCPRENYVLASSSDALHLTDGIDIWSWSEPTARWIFQDSLALALGEAAGAAWHAGRLWTGIRAYWDSVPTVLRSWSPATKTWKDHVVPHWDGARAVGATTNALWVGTDEGLFSSLDTGSSFTRSTLPAPWKDMSVSALGARGDTIAVTVQSQPVAEYLSRRMATFVSFDEGATWNRDADTSRIAGGFLIDESGLHAAILGLGIQRWTAEGSAGIRAVRTRSNTTLLLTRHGGFHRLRGEPGAAVTLRDAQGRVEFQVVLDTEGSASIPRLQPGLHPAQVRGSRGTEGHLLLIP